MASAQDKCENLAQILALSFVPGETEPVTYSPLYARGRKTATNTRI